MESLEEKMLKLGVAKRLATHLEAYGAIEPLVFRTKAARA